MFNDVVTIPDYLPFASSIISTPLVAFLITSLVGFLLVNMAMVGYMQWIKGKE